MLEGHHPTMCRLMKLLVKFDKNKGQDGFQVVLKPAKKKKAPLVKIFTEGSVEGDNLATDGLSPKGKHHQRA